MTATLLRLLAALWRPLAAVLGGLAAYGKGRADAARARDLDDARDYQDRMGRAADAPVHTDAFAARDRLRARDPNRR